MPNNGKPNFRIGRMFCGFTTKRIMDRKLNCLSVYYLYDAVAEVCSAPSF